MWKRAQQKVRGDGHISESVAWRLGVGRASSRSIKASMAVVEASMMTGAKLGKSSNSLGEVGC